MPIIHRRHVSQPPDAVFRVLADLSDLPRWVNAVHTVRVHDDGPVGVGTRFDEIGRFMGRDLVLSKSILEFDPPHTIAHGCPSGPIRNALRFDLAPMGTGTSVTLTALDEPRRLAGLVRRAANRWVQHELARNLDALVRLIEGHRQ